LMELDYELVRVARLKELVQIRILDGT